MTEGFRTVGLQNRLRLLINLLAIESYVIIKVVVNLDASHLLSDMLIIFNAIINSFYSQPKTQSAQRGVEE
jgi:hypothetical protein